MKVLDREIKLHQLLTGSCAAFLALVIVVSVVGNIFPATVQAIGLGWIAIPLKGVYADCSRPENQGQGFCKPKEEKYTRDNVYFRSDRVPNKSRGIPAPFGLNDKD